MHLLNSLVIKGSYCLKRLRPMSPTVIKTRPITKLEIVTVGVKKRSEIMSTPHVIAM